MPQTVAQLQSLETQLKERDAKVTALLSDRAALDAELKALRDEAVAVKAANAVQPDTHDYCEAETRDYYIDLLLKEAGWQLTGKNLEVEVRGMPNNQGKGFVDYVLWGDDGKPLAVVEAKRTRRDSKVGQQQAKLYADCLQAQYGQRPVIFYSNGYEHWMWNDTAYPPRAVQGFFKKQELELMIQRRTSRKPLAQAVINPDIIGRYYQTRAVRRIGETFEKDKLRKALVAMATGAGKTRTVIALADVLMRCNWAKRVLFLADRVALVNQAVNAFKKHLPDSSPVNLVTEKNTDGRVAGLPTEWGDDDEEAKRFDLAVLRTQLAILQALPDFAALKGRLQAIASALEELMLVQAGGSPEVIKLATEQNHGLGIFIRSLVGLDRETAKQAFGQFVAGSTATANQLEFIDLIVQYLTENGVMDAARLYESPFTDISQHGPEAVFPVQKVTELVQVLNDIRQRAVA
jgi:type I site-specific restriction endonuclease